VSDFKNRRKFLQDSTVVTAGMLAGASSKRASADEPTSETPNPPNRKHAAHATPHDGRHMQHAAGYLPIEVFGVPTLPYEMDGDVKVFQLVCEPVKRSFIPGWTFDVWGYNGSVPGPTIEAMEGDRVRIHVTNNLPELTSMHWHGLELPVAMDGVPGVCQDPIMPGETFTYEFDLIQNGTYFYHSHMPMQELIGMIGFFIIHPKEPYQPAVDRDFGLVLQEWAVLPNNTVPNTLSMEFNWLTFNGKAGPDTTPLIVKLGDRVRIRFINMGMDHHPIHIHGNTWHVTGTEGGRIQQSAWVPGNTVLVGVAQARDVEFEAKYVGDWMLHCHLPHHMMNHMMSMVGPMAHKKGVTGGKSMNNGMGMLEQGNALSDEFGPSFGRGMGFGSDSEGAFTNHIGVQHGGHEKTTEMRDTKGPAGGHEGHMNMPHGGHAMPGMENPWSVPGYPQDMFMPDDELYERPENYGLRKGWSGAVEGMTTLVRVLEPEMYEKIRELQKEAASMKPKPHRQHESKH
jgi:manganese oxidase